MQQIHYELWRRGLALALAPVAPASPIATTAKQPATTVVARSRLPGVLHDLVVAIALGRGVIKAFSLLARHRRVLRGTARLAAVDLVVAHRVRVRLACGSSGAGRASSSTHAGLTRAAALGLGRPVTAAPEEEGEAETARKGVS